MFGGNPAISHFAVSPKQDYSLYGEARKAERERMKEVAATLFAHGIKQTTYFQFRNDDAVGKRGAKHQADKAAKKLTRQTGIEFVVAEGCFL